MKIKYVFRYCSAWPKFRLFRLMWTRGIVGDGQGFSAKLSFALRPKIILFEKGMHEWRVVFAGIEIHYARSYGGTFC